MPTASVTAWFLEQVRGEQSRLRASIRALGVRAEAVDDVAQDALVIALEKLDEFDRGGDFGRGSARSPGGRSPTNGGRRGGGT